MLLNEEKKQDNFLRACTNSLMLSNNFGVKASVNQQSGEKCVPLSFV